ncbi:FRG domain-containing protein [Aliivibrio fischeri]|uniref:FRG domain-containing protein n=1 Tax=Aliivibrio fischeri TaxID=668 RepID=UPI0002DD4AAE|nr:FRG domain-containing protein [Aliivibrio fischeri]OEE11606.1 FRG domain-containing protein [Aliivibrio fischeri ZF-211]
MENITITDMNDLIIQLNSLPNNYVFRGHADASWQLTSTLERVLADKWNNETVAKYEEYSLDKFKSKYNIYNHENHEPSSKLAWLCMMQHYGVPTRLLDFSESPYIALYFALEAYNPQSKADIAIYALDYSTAIDKSIEIIKSNDSTFTDTRQSLNGKKDQIFDETVDRFSYNLLWVTEPLELNARIDRQAGCFLISGNKKVKIEDMLLNDEYPIDMLKKYTISGELYQGMFALLRKMNINSKSIYGDLQGLGQSIKMELQVYAS